MPDQTKLIIAPFICYQYLLPHTFPISCLITTLSAGFVPILHVGSLSLMLFLLSFISQTRSSDLVRLLLSRDTVGLLAMAAPHYSLSNDLNADRADVCLYSMPLRWPPVQRRSGGAPGRKRKLILASRNDLLCSRFGLAGRQHAISRSSALSLPDISPEALPPPHLDIHPFFAFLKFSIFREVTLVIPVVKQSLDSAINKPNPEVGTQQ